MVFYGKSGPTSLIIFLLIFIISTLISVEASLLYECPEPEDIFPCYCEEEDDDPMVFCNHLSQPEQISQGIKGLKGHRIYRMSFFMNWILDPVKSDTFSGIAVERILFENSTITLTAPQFKGMENHLSSIHLRAIFNQTNPVGSWSLGHLTKLREVIVERNKITTLADDWLTSVPDSLRTVTLEGNNLVSMGDEVLAKVKHLTFLVLESNRLTTLKRSMLPSPAADLRSINLNYNRIRYLPYDMFTEMPNLRSLEMSNNRLTTLEEQIWSGVMSQLTKLDVSNNAFECDRTLKWMVKSKKPVLLEGNCEKPEELEGKSLRVLKESDLN